jgi:hypothetical protein
VLPVRSALSLAVALTLYVPAVVAVPEIRPAEQIDVPVGRPVPVQVYGAVPPEAESCRLTAEPVLPGWLPGW